MTFTRAQAITALKIRKARNDLLAFTTYTKPDYLINWHHRVIADTLNDFAAKRIRRLILCVPPRYGKTELASRRLPSFLFGCNPDNRIIACSYSADLASSINRDIQRIIDDPTYARIFPDTCLNNANVRSDSRNAYLRNSDIFEIVNATGYYLSAGIGGGIVGRGFDYGIIDDPIKTKAEALSDRIREAIYQWYTGTFLHRQEKDAAILIIMTRWHEDDLVGRLMDLQSMQYADQWTILNFPGLMDSVGLATKHAHDPRTEVDTPLWPEKYDLSFLRGMQATMGDDFDALIQQRPSKPGGTIFKRDDLRYVEFLPHGTYDFVRYWDKASTQGGGAYTAGVMLAYKHGSNHFFIVDVRRAQLDPVSRETWIRETAQEDAQRYGYHKIWFEEEGGSGGKESSYTTQSVTLRGFDSSGDRPQGDKVLRATPLASAFRAGTVFIVENTAYDGFLVSNDWVSAFVQELVAFPRGKFKDQVDAASGAYNKLAATPDQYIMAVSSRIEVSPY